MLADIRYWENDATNKHYAIAHFNVWNAEMLMGVIDAAEEAKSPVIISFGTGFVGNTSFEDFSHMMVSMAQKATVPVITHWDHGRSMEIIHNAWTHGMNSLMRDASAFDFEENIRLTKEAVDFFHPLGIILFPRVLRATNHYRVGIAPEKQNALRGGHLAKNTLLHRQVKPRVVRVRDEQA